MRQQAFPGEAQESNPDPAAVVAPYLYLLGAASQGVSAQAFDCQ
jgi:hypothetical protein